MLVSVSPVYKIQQVESGRLSRAIYQSKKLEKMFGVTQRLFLKELQETFQQQNNQSSIVNILGFHSKHMKSNPSTVITGNWGRVSNFLAV